MVVTSHVRKAFSPSYKRDHSQATRSGIILQTPTRLRPSWDKTVLSQTLRHSIVEVEINIPENDVPAPAVFQQGKMHEDRCPTKVLYQLIC